MGPMGPRALGPWALWAPGTLGPIFENLGNFQKTLFAPKMTISMIWSSRSVLPSQNFDAHLFHVQKKQ